MLSWHLKRIIDYSMHKAHPNITIRHILLKLPCTQLFKNLLFKNALANSHMHTCQMHVNCQRRGCVYRVVILENSFLQYLNPKLEYEFLVCIRMENFVKSDIRFRVHGCALEWKLEALSNRLDFRSLWYCFSFVLYRHG